MCFYSALLLITLDTLFTTLVLLPTGRMSAISGLIVKMFKTLSLHMRDVFQED